MDKLDGKTSDIIKDNIQKLKELFPEILTENKINFDLLRQYLGDEVEANDKFYSFDWYGKEKAIQMAISQSNATLRPDKDSSKDWDNTKNLFIEGDNLEVMRILRQTYREKVKMIYIDPPYNTGKDFVYTDNFTDNVKNYKEKTNTQAQVNPETGGRYHTNWLNMMYPRLRLAKDLLREDGVIFISIDDNEVHNLRKICDEIFGEENFVASMPRKTVEHMRVTADYELQKLNDYILVYARRISMLKLNKSIIGTFSYEYEDNKGKYLLKSLQSSGVAGTRTARPKLFYPIYVKDNKLSLEETDQSIAMYPKKVMNDDGRWLWSKEKFIKDSHLLEYKNGNIYRKYYYDESIDQNRYQSEKTWLDKFPNRLGAKALQSINLQGFFDYTKPLELIKFITQISTNSNDIILDFFAGSGTTAHAVMQLNAEDGGNRKFIMVQLDEETDEKSEAYRAGYKTIAELSRERIRRAGEKIVKDYADKLAERESPLDIGFKAFYLDNTNMSKWDPKVSVEDLPMALSTIANTPIKSDRSEEDVLYEILLKYGIDITLPIVEHTISGVPVYTMGGNIMVICLSHQLTEDIVQGIADLEPEHIVVYDNAFPQDADKLNAENIWNSLESKPKIKTI